LPKKKVHPGQLALASKIPGKPHVQKIVPRKKSRANRISIADPRPDKGWIVAGFDVSMSCIAGAAIAWDRITGKHKGPVFVEHRWTKEDHYFDRLKVAAKSHELMFDIIGEFHLALPLEKIFIAVEEPWPFGMVKGGESGWLKQQAEISGAFLGGLIRYGYENVSQMNTIRWRTVVAEDLGITTHHSKWKDPKLCATYNCNPKDAGKFRTKQWAYNPGYAFMGMFSEEVPGWPDIIHSNKLGNIPRPENSRARAIQPDDRYDALAICWTHFLELKEEELLRIPLHGKYAKVPLDRKDPGLI